MKSNVVTRLLGLADRQDFAQQKLTSDMFRRRFRSSNTGWEADAWRWYHRIPELRSAVNWKANAISRMRLYVGVPDPLGASDPEPVDDPRITRPLYDLYGGAEYHHEMLRRWVQQRQVAGEAFLVAADLKEDTGPHDLFSPPGSRRVWQVVSAQDMRTVTGSQLEIDFATPHGTITQIVDMDDTDAGQAMVLRDWVNDPQHLTDPDSPVRTLSQHVLPLLDAVNSHIKATAESRLAGAGLLAIHEDAQINAASTSTDLTEDPEVAALIDAMVTPIKDRDVASAVTPLMVRYGGDKSASDAFAHLSFSTEFDKQTLPIRSALLMAVAAGMDVPSEIVTSVQDANHWNALYEGQDAVRISLAPDITGICSTLTNGYLRPALRASGIADWSRYVVWWDAKPLTLPPDRSDIALQLAAQGTARGQAYISDEAIIRACGFGIDDMPAPGEGTVTPPNGTSSPPQPTNPSGFPRTNNVGVAPQQSSGVDR